MVVDSSALVAIARREPERDLFLERLSDEAAPAMAAVTWTETRIVLLSRMGEQGLIVLRDLAASANLQIVPVSLELADRAFGAFGRFGTGRHKAGLNFGDCFSYALAAELNQPLLFKGRDFSETDVVPAAGYP